MRSCLLNLAALTEGSFSFSATQTSKFKGFLSLKTQVTINQEATSLTGVSGAGQPSAATPSDPPPPPVAPMFIPKTEPGICMSKKPSPRSLLRLSTRDSVRLHLPSLDLKRLLLLSDICQAGNPTDLPLLLDNLKNLSVTLQICKMVMSPRLLRLSFCLVTERTVDFLLFMIVSIQSSNSHRRLPTVAVF